MPKRDTSWRGDASAEDQGGKGRGDVYGALRRGDLAAAVKTGREIRHPWWRCQSLAIAGMEIDDPKLRLALVDEALSAADELEEPNRIVTVASWPIEVLAVHGPALRLRREVDRLVAVAGTEPHGLRRADALAMLLARAWPDEPARTRTLDAFISTCRVAHGWRRDRLLAAVAPRLAADDPRRAVELVEMIEGARFRRVAQQDVDRVLTGAPA